MSPYAHEVCHTPQMFLLPLTIIDKLLRFNEHNSVEDGLFHNHGYKNPFTQCPETLKSLQ